MEPPVPSVASHPPSRRRRLGLGCAYLLVIALIVWLADHPRFSHAFAAVRALPGGDKAGHFLLLGGLGFVFNYLLRCRTRRVFRCRVLLGSALAFALAALEESSQIFFPSRTFDLLDLAGDALGIWFFGWLAWRIFQRGTAAIPPA